jgi:dipeptidase
MMSPLPLVLLALLNLVDVDACTNLIVTRGCSQDSSNMIAYNADSSQLYGSLYHYPAKDTGANGTRDIFDWDSGRYLGEISEPAVTYNVVGNVNEWGVIIGETTFGGISVLQSQPSAVMDYGSLIWVTLQRSKTAREAISVLDDLMQRYGYASAGESFSISDQKEAWAMEIIGKGSYELGSVWAAVKIPDGSIAGHANQARIQQFPLDDPESALYSSDVISFARKIGIFEGGDDSSFSFSDVYDPVDFSGARFCESRVWIMFSAVMGEDWSKSYLDYAMGYNLTNRMPLYVTPPQGTKISLTDTFEFFRSHFENSNLDMTGLQFPDVGAANANIPYRDRHLTWKASSGVTYLHERPIATQQTGWNYVAQSRSWMPRQLAAVIWFGVDDSATTVRIPVYGSATRVPDAFAGKGAQDGIVPPMMNFDPQKAFYAFNLVANWAYSRWSVIYPDVLQEILKHETSYIEALKAVDSDALHLYETEGSQAAVEKVTKFSVEIGNGNIENFFHSFFFF